MMETLFQLFNQIHPLSTGLQNQIVSILKQRELKKHDFLLKKSQTCSTISFLNTGILHCYYLEDHKKITSWFLRDSNIAVSPRSFFRQRPSDETIEALSPCDLYYITHKEWQDLNNTFPEFNYIGRELTQQYYLLKDEHSYQLQTGTIKDRYDWFLKTFPDLISLVPSRHVATFLGVTEETLSRIRNNKP
jgi:CRP/FNR family transcriptional regulator, anaerobic regulatory protein